MCLLRPPAGFTEAAMPAGKHPRLRNAKDWLALEHDRRIVLAPGGEFASDIDNTSGEIAEVRPQVQKLSYRDRREVSDLANGTQPPRGRSSQVPKQTAIAGFEESPQISPHLMARYKREDLYERVWTVPMRRAQKDSWLALYQPSRRTLKAAGSRVSGVEPRPALG